MRIVPYGEHALLAELADLDAVLGLYAALRETSPSGVIDLVPGARTLLVVVEPQASTTEVEATLRRTQPTRAFPAAGAAIVDLPVVYDGEDLEEVARVTKLSPQQVIERHCAPEYVVGFCGFLPGFGYMLGLDPRLRLPRRATPRVRVPAGAVAIAGEYASVYPRSSPGGWHILGRTNVVLFDVERDPPALLAPATRVRFRQDA